MRAYLIKSTVHEEGLARLGYAGSMGDARAMRQTFVDQGIARKKDIEIEEIEIPTSKAELLAWANEYAVSHEDADA